MPPQRKPIHQRFWPMVSKTNNGCWEWIGAKDPNGYGRINEGGHGGKSRLAHRIAYELCVGVIADGMVIDHLCRNPSCVNPAHLEQVTMLTNSLRGQHPKYVAYTSGVCVRGHRFDEVGVRRYADGCKGCKECIRITSRAWNAKRRLAWQSR